MKKVSRQHLVLKRNTVKTLTELPNTAYRHVVGGNQQGSDAAHGCSGNVAAAHAGAAPQDKPK